MPPGAQEQVEKLENLQAQAQQIAQQKAQVQSKLDSIEQSLDKLDDVSEDRTIYEIVGEILIEAESRDDVIADLREEKEDLEVRLESLERKEEKVNDSFDEIQAELQEQLQGGGMMGGAGGAPQ